MTTKLGWWDRVLMSVAPGYALNRIRSRVAAEQLARHYEAAQPGRRTETWARPSSDADVTLRGAARDIRMISRDLLRNNAWARRGQRTIANNTVGRGIVPKPIGDGGQRALDLWKGWAGTTECESEGRHTFYGIQQLAMKSTFVDGEILLRRRPRLVKDGLTLPLQIQILEADFLDTAQNNFTSLAGGPLIQGIEFDKLGRRAAYWLFAQHPGSGRSFTPSTRVSAEDVIHHYYTERPGQSRGISWLAQSILSMKDLDEYEDAELMKQKIAACFAAFVTDNDGFGTNIGKKDEEDPLVDELEPGMIHQLAPGKEITSLSPPTLTSDALPTRTLRKVAAGLNVTYEELTGDFSQVNYSSARMARLAHWAQVADWQENMLIPILCDRVWQWAMEAAVEVGELDVAPTARWTCPPMPMLEPDKEGLAIQRLVRTGALTISGMIREQGHDPDEHLAEYAADMAKLDAAGIVLDTDARKTTAQGLEQPSETAEKSPEPPAPVAPAKPSIAKKRAQLIAELAALEDSPTEN